MKREKGATNDKDTKSYVVGNNGVCCRGVYCCSTAASTIGNSRIGRSVERWGKRKDLFKTATNGQMALLVVASIIALM